MKFDEYNRPIPNVLRSPTREATRSGRCYEFAYRVQQRTPEPWALHHGVWRFRETRATINHAWLQFEHAGMVYVFCPTWHRTLTLDYCGAMLSRMITKATYTRDEARAALRRTGHYGPTWKVSEH